MEKVKPEALSKEIAMLLIQELHGYCTKMDAPSFVKEKYDRIIEIGELLDKLGNIELMQQAFDILPYEHRSMVSKVWDGTGSWVI